MKGGQQMTVKRQGQRKRGHDQPRSHGAITEPTPAPDEATREELDELLARLEAGIAQEKREMAALLSELRTTLIAA